MAQKVYLIGIGTGAAMQFTLDARDKILNSDLLIGAERMIKAARKLSGDLGVPEFISYDADEIGDYIAKYAEYEKICILLSGDTGFFSGASKLMAKLSDYDVDVLPGISSLSYFCARMKVSWEETAFTSIHGRSSNLIYRIAHENMTFALLSGADDLIQLGDKLVKYGLTDVTLHIGENLSYENERILHVKPDSVRENTYDRLLALIIENPNPRKKDYLSVDDNEFIRGDVPMTKSEVRTISIAKLGITGKAVVYDVGAGTGSVSVQAAMQYYDSKVFAIEKNSEAVGLINANKIKFAADNLEIIQGEATECIDKLEAPTHAFIGGSSGNLCKILDMIYSKNPSCRIVLNAISLETVSNALGYLKEHGIKPVEILEISVSKAKETGTHHLMMGQNPITIIVF